MSIPGTFRKTEGSVGWDVVLPRAVRLAPGEVAVVGLGIRQRVRRRWWWRFCLPYWELHLRSSLRADGLEMGVGIIDADYEGEIKMIVRNGAGWHVELLGGSRVCQLVRCVSWLNGRASGERGRGGLGSTGR